MFFTNIIGTLIDGFSSSKFEQSVIDCWGGTVSSIYFFEQIWFIDGISFFELVLGADLTFDSE